MRHDRRKFHDARGMRGGNHTDSINRGINEGSHTLGGPSAPRGNYENARGIFEAAHAMRQNGRAHEMAVKCSEDYIGADTGPQFGRRSEPAFGNGGRGSTTWGSYEKSK